MTAAGGAMASSLLPSRSARGVLILCVLWSIGVLDAACDAGFLTKSELCLLLEPIELHVEDSCGVQRSSCSCRHGRKTTCLSKSIWFGFSEREQLFFSCLKTSFSFFR
jgi:hypothetical protein